MGLRKFTDVCATKLPSLGLGNGEFNSIKLRPSGTDNLPSPMQVFGERSLPFN